MSETQTAAADNKNNTASKEVPMAGLKEIKIGTKKFMYNPQNNCYYSKTEANGEIAPGRTYELHLQTSADMQKLLAEEKAKNDTPSRLNAAV